MAVDDGALAIGALVELADAMFAQQRQVVHDLIERLAIPHVIFLAELRTPSHRAVS